MEEIPPWLGPSRKSNELSPFDLLDKKQPNGNLQDPINPFEASAPASINPFDQHANKQVDIKSEKIREKMEEIVFSNLTFKDMSLQDVLSELSKKSSDADREQGSDKGVRIFFETAGDLTKTSISLDMADVKLGDALNQVAEQVEWNYRIVEGLVIFSRKSKTDEISPFEQAEKNKQINPFDQAVNN